MPDQTLKAPAILGISLALGMLGAAFLLGNSLMQWKGLDRAVSVKGLSEKEFKADIVIWPLTFTAAGNDLAAIYGSLERDSREVIGFFKSAGYSDSELTVSPPSIHDKMANRYGGEARVDLRYTGSQTITVYSENVDGVRSNAAKLIDLGKKGITIGGEEYGRQAQYLFTKLNEIKPMMIEDATRNAREAASKFAKDSGSKLGKIKTADQGQFSISDRDQNTPYIKKVRVVSTIQYYLTD